MENYELKEIINHLNKPLFLTIIPSNHLIFMKYSNTRYYKYAFELLDTLTKKSLFQNKQKIFHISLYYLLKILFNCGNKPYCSNYDLIILACFFLGVKTVEEQKKMINITTLKNIYPEKYSLYDNSLIKNYEMIIIHLLQYDINILTIYDCICFLLKNEVDTILKKEIFQDFEYKLLNEGVNYYIFKKPMDLAQEIIFEKKRKYLNLICSEPCFSKKKISKKISNNVFNNCKTVLNFGNLGNIESPSTSASFGSGSGQNTSKKKIKIKINSLNTTNPNLNYINEIEIKNNINNSNKNMKNNYCKIKNQLINIKLKPTSNFNTFSNHNKRYLDKNEQSENTDYSLSKNIDLFQSSNELRNTFNLLNKTKNEKYNDNNDNYSKISNNKNLSSIIMDNNCINNSFTNINRNKSIFRKPLIKSITSKINKNINSNNNYINNNFNNNYIKKNKLCGKTNLTIKKIDNKMMNKSITNGNLYNLYKNIINSNSKANSLINSLDTLDIINKYKNTNKIGRKTIIEKYNQF